MNIHKINITEPNTTFAFEAMLAAALVAVTHSDNNNETGKEKIITNISISLLQLKTK